MSSQASRSVLYCYKDHNKINGTLFYCFEYFICAKQKDNNVNFIIYNISDDELLKIKNIFANKYDFNNDFLSDVVNINSIQALYKLNSLKILILDVFTLEKLYSFLRSNIICYSNESHSMIRSINKQIKYYGFYDYQRFDHQVRLKLNFDIFKTLSKVEKDNVFVSSPHVNYASIDLPQELKHLRPITKNKNSHHENLFELFESVYYFHSGLDTNNRLIPECFFYNKKLAIEFNGAFNDSVYLRYTDIKENGLCNYHLTTEDPMIQDFLN